MAKPSYQASKAFAREERVGANELIAVLQLIRQSTDHQITRHLRGGGDDGVDPRDYVFLTRLVGHFMEAGITNESFGERQGFVRGLVDLLCLVVDGCTLDVKRWDPLLASAPAFVRQASIAKAAEVAHG